MKIFALAILIAVLGGAAFAQSKSGIEGVWKITDVTTTGTDAGTRAATQPSMYIFTKKYYSIIFVASDKPRAVMDDYSKASNDQLMDIFVRGFVANAGTYDVKGGKVTFHPVIAKSPSYMTDGSWSASTMTLKGNVLTLVGDSSNAGPAKNPTTVKLARLE